MTLLKNSPISFPVLLAQANLGGGIKPPSKGVFSPPDLANTTILTFANRTFSFLITLMTVLGSIFFLFQFFTGALGWINAGGDSKKVEEARNRITQGVIGLIIIVISYAIVGLISTVLGIEILNPAQFIQSTFVPSP